MVENWKLSIEIDEGQTRAEMSSVGGRGLVEGRGAQSRAAIIVCDNETKEDAFKVSVLNNDCVLAYTDWVLHAPTKKW